MNHQRHFDLEKMFFVKRLSTQNLKNDFFFNKSIKMNPLERKKNCLICVTLQENTGTCSRTNA